MRYQSDLRNAYVNPLSHCDLVIPDAVMFICSDFSAMPRANAPLDDHKSFLNSQNTVYASPTNPIMQFCLFLFKLKTHKASNKTHTNPRFDYCYSHIPT